MPRFDFLCPSCHDVFEQTHPITEEPPRFASCPECGGIAERIYTPPTILTSNPIEGRWNTKQYERLAFDLWPETVNERHQRHTVKNAREAAAVLTKQVQTKLHPREAKRGQIQFPRVG